MIFHITGASGSGKTTLGQKLSKLRNVKVVELDDIDDAIALKLLEKSFVLNFYKTLKQLGQIEVDKIIKHHDKAKNYHLVFTGLVLDVDCDYGFSIDIDPIDLWKQGTLRDMEALCRNASAISSLVKNNTNIYHIRRVMLHKYKVRRPIPRDDVDRYKPPKGYKKLSSDQIYETIVKIIKEN